MIKKLYYILLFVILICSVKYDIIQSINIKNIIDSEFHISENHFTNYVFRRFYFVNRLEKIMSLFFALDKHGLTKKIFLNYEMLFNFDILPFQHKKIKKSVMAMKKKLSLKPLFTIWNDFVNYHSIDDELLVEEFTKEILVVSRNLIISSQIIPQYEKKIYFSDFFETIGFSSYALLDSIDRYVSLFLHYNPDLGNSLYKVLPENDTPKINRINRIIDLKPFVHVDEVMERFYHIQRLTQPCKGLKEAFDIYGNITVKNSKFFFHPNIISCIKMINITKSIEPYLDLWKNIKEYKYIHDKEFIREFFILLYIIYIEMHNNYVSQEKKSSPSVMLETIESLPLEEILHAIDILSKDFPQILEKYELKSDITWKEWFKKYWWTPPLITGALICKVLLALKISKVFNLKTT